MSKILNTLGAGIVTYGLVAACSGQAVSGDPASAGDSLMDPITNIMEGMTEPVSPVHAQEGGAPGAGTCDCPAQSPVVVEVPCDGSGAYAEFELPGATEADMTSLKVIGGAAYIGPNGYSSLPAIGVQEGSIVWNCDINGFSKVVVPGRLAHLIQE